MGLMGEAVSSALGTVKKALLIVYTVSEPELDFNAVAQAAEQSLIAASAGGALGQAAAGAANSAYKVLQVQYNPAAISFKAHAEQVLFKPLEETGLTGVPNQSSRPPAVVLSVELVFDQMNICDSFMWDKYMAGVSAQSVTNIATAVSGKVYSVRQQTDALLACVMRDATRSITFKWADMVFTGELTEVQARYTMFSPKGEPVRSAVKLSITQEVSSKAQNQYWDGAFDKLFGAAGSGDSSTGGKSQLQQMGSLLNIGF